MKKLILSLFLLALTIGTVPALAAGPTYSTKNLKAKLIEARAKQRTINKQIVKSKIAAKKDIKKVKKERRAIKRKRAATKKAAATK